MMSSSQKTVSGEAEKKTFGFPRLLLASLVIPLIVTFTFFANHLHHLGLYEINRGFIDVQPVNRSFCGAF